MNIHFRVYIYLLLCETELLTGVPYTVLYNLCCHFTQFGGFFHFVLVLLAHIYKYLL
jgi:hypothetical protein